MVDHDHVHGSPCDSQDTSKSITITGVLICTVLIGIVRCFDWQIAATWISVRHQQGGVVSSFGTLSLCLTDQPALSCCGWCNNNSTATIANFGLHFSFLWCRDQCPTSIAAHHFSWEEPISIWSIGHHLDCSQPGTFPLFLVL